MIAVSDSQKEANSLCKRIWVMSALFSSTFSDKKSIKSNVLRLQKKKNSWQKLD